MAACRRPKGQFEKFGSQALGHLVVELLKLSDVCGGTVRGGVRGRGIGRERAQAPLPAAESLAGRMVGSSVVWRQAYLADVCPASGARAAAGARAHPRIPVKADLLALGGRLVLTLVLATGFILTSALAAAFAVVVVSFRWRRRLFVGAASDQSPKLGLLALAFPKGAVTASGGLGVALELGLGVCPASDGAFDDHLLARTK